MTETDTRRDPIAPQPPFNLGHQGDDGPWGHSADVCALWDEPFPLAPKPRPDCVLSCGCTRPAPARFGPIFRCAEHGIVTVSSIDSAAAG